MVHEIQQYPMMDVVDRISWEDGLRAFDACEYDIAISHFQKIGSLSKIFYNIGIAQIALDQSVDAVNRVCMIIR